MKLILGVFFYVRPLVCKCRYFKG